MPAITTYNDAFNTAVPHNMLIKKKTVFNNMSHECLATHGQFKGSTCILRYELRTQLMFELRQRQYNEICSVIPTLWYSLVHWNNTKVLGCSSKLTVLFVCSGCRTHIVNGAEASMADLPQVGEELLRVVLTEELLDLGVLEAAGLG